MRKRPRSASIRAIHAPGARQTPTRRIFDAASQEAIQRSWNKITPISQTGASQGNRFANCQGLPCAPAPDGGRAISGNWIRAAAADGCSGSTRQNVNANAAASASIAAHAAQYRTRADRVRARTSANASAAATPSHNE